MSLTVDPIITPRGPVRLRPMTSRDLDRIVELEGQLFGSSAWSYGMLADELGALGRWYIVADLDVKDEAGGDTVIGYAGSWFDGDVSQIMTIGVSPQYQRLSLGTMLLDALINRARQVHAGAILLEVAVNNAAAISLYERHGFERISTRRRYYQPGDIDAYVMRKILTTPTPSPGPIGHEALPQEDHE
ncbi:ribosomal protein S18-alanine N-acetyltransferase [Jonesia quinghaiensis]|uniref:ribosomal protein S18-alanine N-acetyltransferase n=1 Tax=Jonesia quinghaiensis TaxID=262806 RepID=UPI0004154F1A|nr:ribosomal protein S18-alanine N-acetyltransferase [Jonesia quinghaiensis]